MQRGERPYDFQTLWRLPASKERCWQELLERRSWQHWWPALSGVSIKSRPLLEGEELELKVRSPLGYQLRLQLRILRVTPQRFLAVTATGDLEGRGEAIFQDDPGTQDPGTPQSSTLQINWLVRTTKPWMNFFAPVLAPLYRWAHRRVLQDGERRFRNWLQSHPEKS
ncbi:hypothetical protein [Psychromicrobium sp. YIM B11713]|uniref:hypothetical protein n=1 Tax=Psychromicrobium sp. YIM B11713 TaxID=3145233 RepID=UPI00374F418D